MKNKKYFTFMLWKILKKVLPIFLKKLVIQLLNLSRQRLYAFLLKYECKLCMKLLGFKKCEIVFLDTLKEEKVLRNKVKSSIFTPLINDNRKCEYVDAPTVKLYLLSDVFISAKSSNFNKDNKAIIERIPSIELEYCNYSTGVVASHDLNLAVVKDNKKNIKNIDDGIFLGGNGSWNYYHWMTEILPKIQFIQEINILNFTKNILVSISVKKTESFLKTIKNALKDLKVNLIFLEPSEIYKVKNLYVISSPNSILIKSNKTITSPKYIFLRNESLQYVRNLVFEMVKNYNQKKLLNISNELKNKNGKLNIFLSRKKGSAREYNQDEICKMLVQECDIKQIYIEDYSIEEQAFIFLNADLIIGAQGAAWTNLLFCKKGSLAISWIPKHLKDFSAYSTLAEYYGVAMHFIEANPRNIKKLHSGYNVPLNELRKKIRHLNFK
jgi:capsular polysaccharide biosynthesis protein